MKSLARTTPRKRGGGRRKTDRWSAFSGLPRTGTVRGSVRLPFRRRRNIRSLERLPAAPGSEGLSIHGCPVAALQWPLWATWGWLYLAYLYQCNPTQRFHFLGVLAVRLFMALGWLLARQVSWLKAFLHALAQNQSFVLTPPRASIHGSLACFTTC